ncbi:MAG: ABC transporter permease [Acidimicrobiia bacterium]
MSAMVRLVRAELLKIRTTRAWWALLIGVALATAGFVALQGVIALLGPETTGAPTGDVQDPATVRAIYVAGIGTAYLFALALGVLSSSGEFRHHTITATLLAAPDRVRVVVAKAVAVAGYGLLYGAAAVVVGIAVGVPFVLGGGGAARLTSDGVPRSLVLAVLAVALWGLVGLGVGTLIRNQVVALVVTIGVAWIAEPLLAVGLNALDVGAVARFLPSQATAALASPAATANGLTISLLPWWAGALVLLGYALAAGALGAVTTLRRDIA